MEIVDESSFLKSDYDSDLIRPRTDSSNRRELGFNQFIDDENGLPISLDFGNSLEDRISKSWEEQKGVWPKELSSSPKREEQFKELTKNLIAEKKKRKLFQDLLIQKEDTIKKLLDERKTLKTQIGGTSTPPYIKNTTEPPIIAQIAVDDEETTTFVEWMKTKAILEQQCESLKQDLEKKDAHLLELELECKKISLLNWRTTNEKLKQDVEMEVWRRKFNELQQQQIEREDLLKKKDQEIQFLRSELQSKK